ncbi:hypothetical protein HK102_012008 [Quaeritorhiza haematococci]|nr:hypothetical protein HK102_012008 [Quaeritorhiza haematococci]
MSVITRAPTSFSKSTPWSKPSSTSASVKPDGPFPARDLGDLHLRLETRTFFERKRDYVVPVRALRHNYKFMFQTWETDPKTMSEMGVESNASGEGKAQRDKLRFYVEDFMMKREVQFLAPLWEYVEKHPVGVKVPEE